MVFVHCCSGTPFLSEEHAVHANHAVHSPGPIYNVKMVDRHIGTCVQLRRLGIYVYNHRMNWVSSTLALSHILHFGHLSLCRWYFCTLRHPWSNAFCFSVFAHPCYVSALIWVDLHRHTEAQDLFFSLSRTGLPYVGHVLVSQ